MAHTYEQLKTWTDAFMAAFNSNDLDGVVGFFAEDGIYDEFSGRSSSGVEAVRAAFTPQFEGAFGEMKFIDEDLFIDEQAGKVMASWRCTLEAKGEPTSWRGLDLIHFDEHGKVTHKSTYAKTKAPGFEPLP